MAWEERCRVSVGAHPEEDQIEDGEPRGIFRCEFVDEVFFVCVCEVFECVFCEWGCWGGGGGEGRGEERGVDVVDVGAGDGDFGEELVDAEFVV